MFAHDNDELIDQWPRMLAPYLGLGVSVLLPECRGYGRSTGLPSELARTLREAFVLFPKPRAHNP